jgi:hypothetical protein
MRTFNAIAGQSIYDVCLQTYGSLDYLYKLMQDNGILGLNENVSSRQSFAWDDSLVVDQLQNAAFAASKVYYSTDMSYLGNVYYSINRGPISNIPNVPGTPYTPPAPAPENYNATLNTTWTSGADGIQAITPLDINGNSLAGVDIIQVELEIKPLIPEGQVGAQYVWNKQLGILTLTNNTYADFGQTLSILYNKQAPYTPPVPIIYSYIVTLNTTWTSGADGTQTITPLDINGNSLAGVDIIQVELEIKPLIPEGQANAQYVWNKSLGILTLVNNTYADFGQTLSIFYNKLVIQ